MKSYLEGRRQARKHYKPYKNLLIGAGIGTGVAMYSLFPIKYGEKERELYLRDTITNSVVSVRFEDSQSLIHTFAVLGNYTNWGFMRIIQGHLLMKKNLKRMICYVLR